MKMIVIFVLILVVMEDALALIKLKADLSAWRVLILVVMEDALAHVINAQYRADGRLVLILVVMEDALAHELV